MSEPIVHALSFVGLWLSAFLATRRHPVSRLVGWVFLVSFAAQYVVAGALRGLYL